jgi:hypothetical protein
MKKYNLIKFTALIIIAAVTMSFTLAEQGGKGPSTFHKTKLLSGDSYDLYINNIDMPVGSNGVMADVLIPPATIGGGKLNNKIFLFSGGFYMSGLTNGIIWANGMLSASRVTDYVPGTYATGANDPNAQLYVVKSSDADFSQSWVDWEKAVALGADYYDGNHDGVYNPVDLNGNGKWDPDEDRPDILGDATLWCVYSDQTPPPNRTFNDVSPQGIEIRQTVFAFNSKGTAGNIIFIRYKIVNTGYASDTLNSVYFSVGADADVGDSGNDDLVGSDTLLNAGFTYHILSSTKWGTTPPCFLIDFFQGPKAYIPGETFIDNNGNGIYDAGDTPIDTATDVRGRIMGLGKYPGAKNLGISSFHQYYNGIDPQTRFELRDYTLGLDNKGSFINPCTWTEGNVFGVNCANVDPSFMYSGDPVTNTGWINTVSKDQRQISSTGPFQLVKNDTIAIVVAYVIGQGTNGLNSVAVAKSNDITAQNIFDANFPSLPPPPDVAFETKTGDGFIDLTWPTSKNIKYQATDSLFQVSRSVHGFYITQYYSNAQSPTNDNQPNSQVIARYDLRDSIYNIYYKTLNGGVDLRMPQAPESNKLDSTLAADPAAGRIVCRLTLDPSTGNPFIKGHDYYFSVTEYTINNWAVVNKATNAYGPAGDYYDPTGTAVEEFESKLYTVTMGTNEYAPSISGQAVKKTNGPSNGQITYLIADKNSLTGDIYKINFFSDTNPLDGEYTPSWTLTNTKTGVMIDSSKEYNADTTNYLGKVTEGFIARVDTLHPEFGSPVYSNNNVTISAANSWFNTLYGTGDDRGVFYVGQDVRPPTSTQVGIGFDSISTARSSIITADKLRKVELRFGPNDSSYAYRYINGFVGSNLTAQRGSNIYAGLITGSDTTGKGPIGNWVAGHANGLVKVPFSAWVVDSSYNETRQLAVAFIERRVSLGGNPDGIWDPGTSVIKSREIILIFDSPYTDTSALIQYTGTSTNKADIIKGYTLTGIVSGDSATDARLKAIAKSPWFNTMYVVALDRKDSTHFFNSGDRFTIPVVTYPYTSSDEYQFKTVLKGGLTASDTKSLFDKITVFPNPLYGYNPQTGNVQNPSDAPWVTFSNLPEQVTINIFTLSGTRIRTLTTADKSSPTSPFLKWNLQNEAGLRVASGMYLAIVSCPGLGDKVLKFAIIMPQKQINFY